MMKKIIAVGLVLCAVALAGCANEEKAKTPSSGSSGVSSVLLSTDNTSNTSSDTESKIKYTSGDYSYYIVDDGIVITEYHGSGVAHVVIPETIDGHSVVELCGAFERTDIESVTLPETLKRITGSPFYRTVVSELHIPKSVEYIDGPFFKSAHFRSYTVDPANPHYTAVDGVLFTKDMKTLVSYPECAERTKYAIPEGVETIGKGAFAYAAWNLKQLTIPSSLKEFEIDSIATKLEEVNVHADNPYYCSVDGVVYNKDVTRVEFYPSGSPRKVWKVPESVRAVTNDAFICIPMNLEEIHVAADTYAHLTDDKVSLKHIKVVKDKEK